MRDSRSLYDGWMLRSSCTHTSLLKKEHTILWLKHLENWRPKINMHNANRKDSLLHYVTWNNKFNTVTNSIQGFLFDFVTSEIWLKGIQIPPQSWSEKCSMNTSWWERIHFPFTSRTNVQDLRDVIVQIEDSAIY